MGHRTGIGMDAHRFADGRRLVLGGVEIDHPRGLAGHSDADVLIHAIADALLGAAGLEDIGHYFPDSDPAFKDADSTMLLEEVVRLVAAAGCRVGNIDAVLVMEQPRVAPYRERIRERLAEVIGVPVSAVSVRGTTTEQMGFTGRGEGIAAMAVTLLECGETKKVTRGR
ncbi:MAG: 2-C-methyl-D-erythritol 2,4-cyclodiphosphate synthase [Thermoleophilia bacterium]